MKYNPAYHHNVVDNWKRDYAERYGKPLTLADEKIWQIAEEWQYTDDVTEDTLEALNDAQQES
jgi:hypothetical protein